MEGGREKDSRKGDRAGRDDRGGEEGRDGEEGGQDVEE